MISISYLLLTLSRLIRSMSRRGVSLKDEPCFVILVGEYLFCHSPLPDIEPSFHYAWQLDPYSELDDVEID